MDAWATLTLVVSSKATIALTSLAPNLLSSSTVSQAQSKTYGPFGVPTTVVVTAVDQGVTYDVAGNLIVNGVLVDGDGNPVFQSPNSKYHFMASARAQTADESVFRNLVNTSNAAFGTHLSVANAWANIASGYISTLNPAADAEDPVIRIPAPSFDMVAGEALLIFWSGQVTPEGSDAGFMGNSISSGESGFRLRVKAAGTVDITLFDGAGNTSFGPTTTLFPFVSGTLGNFALWLDGTDAGWVTFWVGGTIQQSQAIVKRNTLSADTIAIGKATSNVASTDGIVTKTLAVHMLKWGASDVKPTITQLSAAVAALNRNPLSVIAQGAL